MAVRGALIRFRGTCHPTSLSKTLPKSMVGMTILTGVFTASRATTRRQIGRIRAQRDDSQYHELAAYLARATQDPAAVAACAGKLQFSYKLEVTFDDLS